MLPDGSLINVNPYEALPQIRVICEALGIELGPEPTPDEIQNVLFPLGRGKVYGANSEELPIDQSKLYQDTVLDAIDQLLEPVPLRTVYDTLGPTETRSVKDGIETTNFEPLMAVAFAGTERWNVRRASELSLFLAFDYVRIDGLVLLAGNRPHDDKAGASPYVDAFKASNKGQVPVEHQLMAIIYQEKLGDPSDVVCVSNDLDDNAREFARRYQQELENGKRIYIPTNTAAEDKPIQIRTAIREIVPRFDADPANPQLYFSADGSHVGRTPNTDPAIAQRAGSFLSYIPRIVNVLYGLKS